MKNPIKLVRNLLALIIILIVLVVVLIHLFGNRALKAGIESAATKTLDVGVTIDDVDLSIISGKVGFQNLAVSNPPGYQHEKLLELADARIAVQIRSLLSDMVNVRQIKLDGLNVVVEQKGLSNNLNDVIKNIPGEPDVEDQKQKPGKKLHIDTLEITNTKVNVKLLPIPGKADTLTLTLPPIKMTDLGSDNKLNTAALAGKVLVAIANAIAQQGSGVLPEQMLGPLTSELSRLKALSGVIDKGSELLEGTKDLRKEVTEGIEGIKGLLKPKSDN